MLRYFNTLLLIVLIKIHYRQLWGQSHFTWETLIFVCCLSCCSRATWYSTRGGACWPWWGGGCCIQTLPRVEARHLRWGRCCHCGSSTSALQPGICPRRLWGTASSRSPWTCNIILLYCLFPRWPGCITWSGSGLTAIFWSPPRVPGDATSFLRFGAPSLDARV